MNPLLPRRAEAVGLLHHGNLGKKQTDIAKRQQQKVCQQFRYVQLPQRAADCLDRGRGHQQERRKQAENALQNQRQHGQHAA